MRNALALFTAVLVLLALLRPAAYADEYHPRSDSKITVLYVGAMNCPPCRIFALNDEPGWKASAEFSQVEYVHVMVASYKNMTDDYYWQDPHLHALRDLADIKNYAPQFVVIVDDHVVLHQHDNWPKVQQLISALVAEKKVALTAAK